ncbi:hypothetical protein CERSUDRAFT_96363 [Gelatoporia subvermispora B]|uniref:Uncharacterized protein n=1 Tax=Ceriporiopsis subvermispora (strain B) TaxID=914234 RepID=M2PIY0_CERS8|nr:hypothetical protein CERSUDRAFT_96363 [Gelatoporia subvermispora B]
MRTAQLPAPRQTRVRIRGFLVDKLTPGLAFPPLSRSRRHHARPAAVLAVLPRRDVAVAVAVATGSVPPRARDTASTLSLSHQSPIPPSPTHTHAVKPPASISDVLPAGADSGRKTAEHRTRSTRTAQTVR